MHKKLTGLTVSLSLLMSVLSPFVAEAQTSTKSQQTMVKKTSTPKVLYKGKVISNSVIVRLSATTKAKKIGSLKKNQVVEVVKTSKSWSKIKFKKSYGWITSKDIKKISIASTKAPKPKPVTPTPIPKTENTDVVAQTKVPALSEMPKLFSTFPSADGILTIEMPSSYDDYLILQDNLLNTKPKYVILQTDIPKNEWKLWNTDGYKPTILLSMFHSLTQEFDSLLASGKPIYWNTKPQKAEWDMWEKEYKNTMNPNANPDYNLLSTYHTAIIDGKIVLEDTDNGKYNLMETSGVLKQFGNKFANSIKDLTPEEKVHVIYDYIYHQIQYNPNASFSNLLDGKKAPELSNKGFARFFYELANDAGLKVRIIRGENHYWNQWKTPKGNWITIDLSTDILSQTKHGATGLSEEARLAYVNKVGKYSPNAISPEAKEAVSMSNEDKQAFLSLEKNILKEVRPYINKK